MGQSLQGTGQIYKTGWESLCFPAPAFLCRREHRLPASLRGPGWAAPRPGWALKVPAGYQPTGWGAALAARKGQHPRKSWKV